MTSRRIKFPGAMGQSPCNHGKKNTQNKKITKSMESKNLAAELTPKSRRGEVRNKPWVVRKGSLQNDDSAKQGQFYEEKTKLSFKKERIKTAWEQPPYRGVHNGDQATTGLEVFWTEKVEGLSTSQYTTLLLRKRNG